MRKATKRGVGKMVNIKVGIAKEGSGNFITFSKDDWNDGAWHEFYDISIDRIMLDVVAWFVHMRDKKWFTKDVENKCSEILSEEIERIKLKQS
jgi:hypothetical protein